MTEKRRAAHREKEEREMGRKMQQETEGEAEGDSEKCGQMGIESEKARIERAKGEKQNWKSGDREMSWWKKSSASERVGWPSCVDFPGTADAAQGDSSGHCLGGSEWGLSGQGPGCLA